MKFSAASLLALASAVAAQIPGPPFNVTEKATVYGLYARKLDGKTVSSVSFNLTADAAPGIICESVNSTVGFCGGSTEYSFFLENNGTDTFPIVIHHNLAGGYGIWGMGPVSTYCHAGGAGINDMICSQLDRKTDLTLSFTGNLI